MKIGVNFLREVQELHEEHKIDFVDYFKLYSINSDLSYMDWCLSQKWMMFHGVIGQGSNFAEKDFLTKTDFKATKEVLKKCKSPYCSGHIITFQKQNFEECLDTIKENVAKLKEELNLNIALENFPYRPKINDVAFLIHPDVISSIVRETDSLYLFDISHARKAAEFLNMTLEQYVDRLPMERVVEFHLAGMYYIPDISNPEIASKYTEGQLKFIHNLKEKFGNAYDFHGKLNEEDYEFLEKAISKYKNTLKYITLEYGSFPYWKFPHEDYSYPFCDFEHVYPIVKSDVLEQLTRIHEIVEKAK